MYIVEKTSEFDKWFRKLKDLKAKAKILVRIQRIEENGNFGEFKQIGSDLKELKITYGPGYRVYYIEKDGLVIILLAGGDKSTQSQDIEKAKRIMNEVLKADGNENE